MFLASKTIKAINDALEEDQGAGYRKWLGKVLPHIGDAYKEDSFPFRLHLGASGLGDDCARKIWYSFRWASLPRFDGRMLRLFNRGHLEEGRIIALLLMIGVKVYQQDENGKQFRISSAGGHVGGSGDGVAIGVPDLPNVPMLLEFKTSSDKSFLDLQKNGVRSSKFIHYVQMQVYMVKMQLSYALYIAVNKNTDELYAEIILADYAMGEQFIERADKLAFMREEPNRISNSPGWFACRYCDYKSICHNDEAPHRNCRTCVNSFPEYDGTWRCSLNPEIELSKDDQFKGCENWESGFK